MKRRSSGSAETAFGEPVSVSPSLDQCLSPPLWPQGEGAGGVLLQHHSRVLWNWNPSNYEETDFIISYCFAMKLNELQSVNVGLFVLQSGRSVSRSYHLLSDPGKLRNAPFPAAADDRAVLPGEADACAVLPGEAALT
ncbi:uncharacterized protein nisch [Conger conger]|uniref:uncharacterized protein nisch n=1 Tax=Conger conger TaxID=82655 RepID=UPI002A59FF00|nr:uncharacterized protein nisch [Conger conger]